MTDPNVLHRISYGMFIVSSYKDKALNGQVANTVFQITSDPATIAIGINKNNLTHEFIDSSRCFGVSILEEDTPLPFIGKFGFKSGRNEDKFKDLNVRILPSGCPAAIDHSIAYLEAKVVKQFDCLTHTLFLGQMTESVILQKEGRPMTYDYYYKVKGGFTPSSAPTFIKGER